MAGLSTFPDFCLNCDRQIDLPREVYCSEHCRLADLCATSPSPSPPFTSSSPPFISAAARSNTAGERASRTRISTMPRTVSAFHSTTPSKEPASLTTSSSTSGSTKTGAFVLPPAYDFSSHRHSTASISSVNSVTSSQRSSMIGNGTRPPSSYFAFAGSNNILLSSSEAAKKTLSPTSSRSSITSAGDEGRHELRAYESNFDVTRDWRRRRASVYDGAWRN